MGTKLNSESYAKLIMEDIQELNKAMPDESLERKHIEFVLEWTVKELYGEDSEGFKMLRRRTYKSKLDGREIPIGYRACFCGCGEILGPDEYQCMTSWVSDGENIKEKA